MKNKIICLLVSMLFFATVFTVAGDKNINKNDDFIFDIDNWSMLGHDAQRTSYSTSTGPVTNETLFTQSITGTVLGGISAQNGYIYTSTFGKHLYCINAYTGDIIFDHTNPGLLSSVPAIDNDRIYFGSYDENLYCLNATTGAEIWTYPSGGDIYSSPAIYNDKIYVGGYNNKMMCVDMDGNEVWTYTVGGFAYSPALDDEKVYFGSNDNKVYCLNSENGDYIWDYQTGGDIKTPVLLSDGNVYFYSTDHSIYCLNDLDGSFIWSKPINSGSSDQAIALGEDKLFSGSDSNKFYCLNPETGTEIWNFSTTASIRSTPAVADGKVYFSDTNKNVYCLDVNDGSLIWIYRDSNTYVQSALAIYDGNLYLAGSNNVFCFGTFSNQPPEIPATPSGPTEGEPNIEYTFATATTDPDEDNVYYMFDWGNGEFSDWLGPYASGDEIEASYTWTEEGTYDIKVKAKDTLDQETEYSDAHTIEIAEVPDPEPVLSIKSIEGGNGITLVLENTGDADATDIEFTITIEGGLFVLPREMQGSMNLISAGEQLAATEMPVFGIGLGILTDMPIITVSAECAEGSSDDDSVEAQIILSKVTIQE